MAAILSRPQCVNMCIIVSIQWALLEFHKVAFLSPAHFGWSVTVIANIFLYVCQSVCLFPSSLLTDKSDSF